jgi:hypothetical protein
LRWPSNMNCAQTIRLSEYPGQVLELVGRIAAQAAFIRLLKQNGEAVLAGVGQDVLKDLRKSLQAARKEVSDQAATKEKLPKR